MTVNQNDIIEASARLEFDNSEDVVNVYQWQKQDAVPSSDADMISDIVAFVDAIYVTIASILTVLAVARDIRVRNKTQGTVFGSFPFVVFNGGNAVDDATAPGVAILANFSTGVARVTPRKYIGILTEGNMDNDGTWSSGAQAGIVAALSPLLVPQIGASGTYKYGYDSSKTLQFEEAVSLAVTNIPAYQRRRRQGRGS